MPYVSVPFTRKVEYFKKGTLVPSGKPTVVSVLVKSSALFQSDTRSALLKSVPDSRQWRPPLPYSRSVSDRTNEWMGSLVVFNPQGSLEDSLIEDYPFSTLTNDKPASPTRLILSVPTSFQHRAEVEALLKIKELKVQYAVALAEARKSMKLIESSIWALYDSYKAAKQLKWKKALAILRIPRHEFRRSSKDVSGRWLELQYGWGPLLSDLSGAYDDARRGILASEPRFGVVREVKKTLNETVNMVDVRTGLPVSYKDKGVYGCRVRLDFVLKDDLLRTLSNVGLTNPAEIVWEMTPFSFLIDWAVPLGNWLAAWDATLGLTFRGGSRTNFIKAKRTGTFQYHRGGFPPSRGIYSADLRSYELIAQTSRKVYEEAPIPVPYLKNPVSAMHALNGLALLRSLLK